MSRPETTSAVHLKRLAGANAVALSLSGPATTRASGSELRRGFPLSRLARPKAA